MFLFSQKITINECCQMISKGSNFQDSCSTKNHCSKGISELCLTRRLCGTKINGSRNTEVDGEPLSADFSFQLFRFLVGNLYLIAFLLA